MSIVCVIPVRGGSVGIPRKNLSEISGGVTLLEWTIDQALRCFPSEDVFVSTEDPEMARVAEARGANVVVRPEALARDDSTTVDVVEHLLSEMDSSASRFDAIFILQVTSPLRRDEDVVEAITLFRSGNFDSVVGAFEVTDTHPAKMYFLEEGVAKSVAPEYETHRRQDLPPVYRRNGSIFLVRLSYYAEVGLLWGGRVGLVRMPRDRSIDIDTPEDLERARAIVRSDLGG